MKKLQDIQKRILEVEKQIGTEYSGILNTPADVMDRENLKAELRVLERQEQFSSNKEQVQISRRLGVASVIVGLTAVIVSAAIAYGVPSHQRKIEEQAQVEAVYKNLITNQDIFISNANASRKLSNSNNIADLPESYIEDEISDAARKTIQNKFGLVQYRFFLYYLQQTALLNEEIGQIRSEFISKNVETFGGLFPTAKYLASVNYLTQDEGEEKNTRLDYQKDTECIQFFFEINFKYLSIDGRGKAPECSNESLDRIFNYFGYLPADTPVWLRPYLRRTLNTREPGLGNRLIEL